METPGSRNSKVSSGNSAIDDSSNPYFLHHSDDPSLVLVSQSLIGENYASRSHAMLIALSVKNKLGFLDGSIPKLAGGVTCEELDQDTCAFAVSSLGKRCVLEKHIKRSGEEAYTCRASDIEADKLKDVIETDHCIKACGVDRKTLGISSDSLLESRFTQKFCSPNCYDACPNIVDLYFNLAAGEGVFLPKLCEAQGANARRGMAELKSSGFVAAPAPLHSARLGVAPVVSPIAEAPAPIYYGGF